MKPQTRHQTLTLWLPVTLAFVVLIAAWFTLIKIAVEHPVESVPLEHTGAAE